MPLPIRWRYKLDRWRSQLAGMFHPEPKPRRPRLCPACGTLVGATATRCHQCGASMTFSLAAANKALARLLPQTSPATYAILTLCCLMYGLSVAITLRLAGEGASVLGRGLMSIGGISSEANIRLGASLPLVYNLEQPWRLVTAVFLHGGLLHIGMNMWVLMDIGPIVEELYGSARYFFLFTVAGAFGYVVSSGMGHFSVGASGALLGLIGVLLAATQGASNLQAIALRGALIRWLIYIAVIGLMIRGTDNAAHFGGLAAGYVLGRLMPARTIYSPGSRRVAEILGWATGAVVAASFGFMVWNYLQHT